jgi:cytochrome c
LQAVALASGEPIAGEDNVDLVPARIFVRCGPRRPDRVRIVRCREGCRQCHSYKQGDNRLGPSLYGVVGRKSGTAPSYGNYSDSLKNAGITWTPEQLEKWIADPEAVVPNNNMKPYPGVADADQRRQIVEFLKSDTQLDGKSAAAGGAQ